MSALSWLAKYDNESPIFRQPCKTHHALAVEWKVLPFSVFGLKAHASVSIAKNASLDKKVEFLISQVSALDKAIVNVDGRVDDLESSLKTTKENLKESNDALSKSLKTTIAGHIIGDYDANLFGIIITICGTLFQFFSV